MSFRVDDLSRAQGEKPFGPGAKEGLDDDDKTCAIQDGGRKISMLAFKS
jgi:hypothetical protein